MGQAYTPGLTVAARVRHCVTRRLPLTGEVLVRKGETVEATRVVARALLPGPARSVNVAALVGVDPAELQTCLLVQEGQTIAEGAVLARTKGIFGMGRREIASPCAGVIESISARTGQMIVRGEPLRVELAAHLAGMVVDVREGEGATIENNVTLVQGIFGVGGERCGPLRFAVDSPGDDASPERITALGGGPIVVAGRRVTRSAFDAAHEAGVSAIIAGGIDDEDLRGILGYDLGVAVTGSEAIGTTIILTEGFGEIAIARRTFELLRSREGSLASVSGATQIRAGVVRPEILIPVTGGAASGGAGAGSDAGQLVLGRSVRLVRDPWFGALGEVAELPAEPQVLESESRARVAVIRLNDGRIVRVPRANVEIIEGTST